MRTRRLRCVSLRDWRGVGWCLQSLAMVDTAAGRAARAAWLYGAAERCFRAWATGQVTFSRVQIATWVPCGRSSENAFRDAFERGRNTPLDRIMAAAEPREG